MVWVRLPVYFYKRNDTFYFSRLIPSDLQHRFQKRRIVVSLRTKSEAKAAKSAAALSDRLERYWDSLRMEMIYSRELGLRVTPDAKTTISAKSFSITEALALYHRLKGGGKTKLFFESSERSMRYLTDCLRHEDLAALEISWFENSRSLSLDANIRSSMFKCE
jgi:hypothetical protein